MRVDVSRRALGHPTRLPRAIRGRSVRGLDVLIVNVLEPVLRVQDGRVPNAGPLISTDIVILSSDYDLKLPPDAL